MIQHFFLAMIMFVSMANAAVDSADSLYAHEKWSAALEAYEKEVSPSSGMLVRMGECAVRAKNYATGLRHWYRASRGLYWLSYYAIAMRIFALEAEAGIHAGAPTPVWYVATSCAAIPPLLWQLCLLMLLLFGAWRVGFWWQHQRYASVIVVFLGIVFCGGFAWWSMNYRTYISAIVLQPVTLRTGPDVRFSELSKLLPPTPVFGEESASLPDGPLYYKISDGKMTGWVRAESLILV